MSPICIKLNRYNEKKKCWKNGIYWDSFFCVTRVDGIRELSFFTRRRGPSVCDCGLPTFSGPPLACAKKFSSPPRHAQKNSGPNLGLCKKIPNANERSVECSMEKLGCRDPF